MGQHHQVGNGTATASSARAADEQHHAERQSQRVERRLDPEDGAHYTWEECLEKYADMYASREIEQYWQYTMTRRHQEIEEKSNFEEIRGPPEVGAESYQDN